MSDIKDPEEVVDLSFDFTKDLGAEAIQAGTPVVTIAVLSGADPGAAAMLQGAPTILGAIVFQRLKDGVDRADYKARCKVTTSGGRKLVLSLPVRVRTI